LVEATDVLVKQYIFFNKGVNRGIVSLKRINVVVRVCHVHERDEDKFFYVYLSLFLCLHVHLPFDEFTMVVLCLLNIVPTEELPEDFLL